MIIVTILLAAACAVLALPVVSDVIALVRRARPARNNADTSARRSRLLFLVPAHNEELLSAGVKIYEYQRTMMHTKAIVVDGKWSVVGSANMDVRSVELNLENVIGILDEDFARTLEATFEQDLKGARQLHLEDWRRRGAWERVKERLASLLAEQY